ncbi:MAG: signal peptidase II [Calditrichaeota bacterium]|nr:signal peptidase II [Calditrichota bacterium]MCB9368717.1 signal peptidase II [Calditrichota bacterium]
MTSSPASRPAVWPWLLGFAVLLGLDQLTKYWVRSHFVLGESIPVIGEYLRLTYVQNPGVAFGLEPFSPTILLIFGSLAAIALGWYLIRLVRHRDLLKWPVFLFLSGAVGNSIDRAMFGSVTDFLDADFPDFIMDRWPVFNVADSCVTIGIAILVWQTLFVKTHAPLSPSSGERPDSSSLSSASGSGTETAPAGPLSDASPSGDLPK